MLKYILLATTMTIAAPAMAQETTTSTQPQTTQPAPPDTPTPVQDPSAQPAPAEPMTPPAPTEAQTTAQTPPVPATPAAPAEGQPVETAQPVTPATPATAAEQPVATAQPAPSEQPATSPVQVSEVVTKEFPVYDKDSSGALDATEFGAWMAALRKASEPTFQAESAEATTWIGQAFAQADADKNKSVNQGELTTFLTPKAS
jgi:hypothetical protein